ncbi:MAG: chromosome segregation protein SMC [Candidatus Bathyarchaeota archaeon]|nr:chromosome segregation protein SMC [Candidatus Bathyarchaeota archaeon]
MPHIKRIEINGFKTFAHKTTLAFDRGFTAITGPNGSGKTNIIDAILFCLGELSAKRLRAENFSNLIFNGGEKSNVRKSEAKVTIQLDNSDGRLPVETTTVTISREIDRNGESVYRINGRRAPRNHMLEILSVAGISPYGHNIVLQGTLTRMAEISTIERRKIIEDMLGIAQYDAEKAEAEGKLKEAETAIKTALGQISEIQRRVEDLERERNNLLRHNFLKREVARLEAVKISREIRRLEDEANKVSGEISEIREKNNGILELRENLRLKRRSIDAEMRKLGFDEIEKKRERIIEVQMESRNLKSRLNELSAKINGGKIELERLRKTREDLQRQHEEVKVEINRSEEKIKQLSEILNQVGREIVEKQTLYNSFSEDLSKIRLAFEEKSKRVSEIELQLSQIREDRVKIESEYGRVQSRLSVYVQRLEDLKSKRSELKESHSKLCGLLANLEGVLNDQREQMKKLQEALDRRIKQRDLIRKEMENAEKIADLAKEALIEFEARKDLMSKINPEELALKTLEELSTLGVISGIHGRLKKLIKIEKGYERAVEAAASGWLDSLVVNDLDVAFTCIETLKRMKLGRVKVIPLNTLSGNKNTIKTSDIEGVSGPISSFVKCEKLYEPAVNFVLGDTLLAMSEDAAIRASKDGFRAVTLNGDLYEAGGGVESGFYRAPIDISSFIPSEKALKNLEQAVKALRSYLENRDNIVAELESEVSKTRGDIASLSETLIKFEGEFERVKKGVSQSEMQIKRVEENIENMLSRIEEDKARLSSLEDKINEMNEKEGSLSRALEQARKELDLLKAQDVNARREALADEIVALKQKYSQIELDISMEKSKIETILKRKMRDLAAQINEVSERISSLEKEVGEAVKEEVEARRRIGELEVLEKNLSEEVSGFRERIKSFTSEIDALDGNLAALEREYENGVKTLNDLEVRLQAINLRISQLKERLKALENEAADLADSSQYSQYFEEDIDSHIASMLDEIKRIGAVNQLAESQYAEQTSRYKELSVRLNDLEREKLAILKFIEEIEQKKMKIFMEAFNRINERLNNYFSRLTGGGAASLKLENPDNPFAGGVDMIVQFPNKQSILVSGASSGERSVSAVAFLFALQEFSPTSFYLFDEIDAHLDAFHVERLGELLAEEASKMQLQFIVITLKPEMISKADRVYGVYSQNGISHVVSMTFKGVMQGG